MLKEEGFYAVGISFNYKPNSNNTEIIYNSLVLAIVGTHSISKLNS